MATTASTTWAPNGSPSGSRPAAKCPPGQVTVGGLSASHESWAAAWARAFSNAALASANDSPGITPYRPSATRRSGTVLAQSPAWMMPTLMGHGSSPNGKGGAALRTVSSSARAWCRSSNAVIALRPVARIDPCVARPTTSIRNVNEPALAATTWPSVGSAMTQASPTCPRRRVAYVPRPPSSSPITVWTANGRLSSMPLTARAAAMIATTPPFMSQTPRPYQRVVVLADQPRVGVGPGLGVARRDDVDVSVEDQRRGALAGDPDAAERLLAVDLLTRIVGGGAQLVEVEASTGRPPCRGRSASRRTSAGPRPRRRTRRRSGC